MVIKVEHPNGYAGVLYGKSSMSIYDKDGHECLHTGFRTPNTEEELYEVLEDMPRTMEIIEQTEREIAKAIVHKMIDDAVIAEDAYPDLRQKMHDAVDEYEPQTERSE